MTTDVLIVGAGPVGLATAIYAAQAGMRTRVLDKHVQPIIDKSCGEGLMPGGVAALRTMGVDLPTWQRQPFLGIRYNDGALLAEGRFRNAVGWGVRRTALHEAMLTRARALGVEVSDHVVLHTWEQDAEQVTAHTSAGLLQARWLVGADGLHSRVREQAGLSRPARGARRFGIRQHFEMSPWSPWVEVFLAPGCEAYVTPVGPHQVGVAILWDGSGGSYDTLLGRFPALLSRIEGAPACSKVRGAGPFKQAVARRFAGRVALVGDAAGYADALTGEGLTLGFRCADALVQTLCEGAPLTMYERAYRRLSRPYYRSTALMLQLARRPALRHEVIRLLAAWPGLFDTLLNAHSLPAPPSAMNLLPDAPRFGRLKSP